MSTLMSWLSCHWFPLLLGALAGWLLNRWLCKCKCNSKSKTTVQNVANTPAAATPSASPAPAAMPLKAAEAPTAQAAPSVQAAAPAATVIDLAAAKKAGFSIKNANDLTVVEGIGPKINELFNNAGINTFVQLAAATVPQMRKILDDGGSRFRIANPATWAQQGALAAENKWEALKKLQDELSAGLKK